MPDFVNTIAYRIVVGAIHNTLHGHPRWVVPNEFARSVAKRAAGTLVAHFGPSALAVPKRSKRKQRQVRRVTAVSGQAKCTLELRLLSRMHRELTVLIALHNKDGTPCDNLILAARMIKQRRKEITPCPNG